MRFIHTADWHLGNQMHEIDRREEAEAFFRWLKTQIIEKNAVSLVVSGDIFDTTNPSVEARRLYYSFLASLVDSPCKNVIIVGGNHDSALMLESSKELLDVLNIHVVGSVNGLRPADMCFELFDANGSVSGICMAVPFLREVELRNLIPEEKIPDTDLYSTVYQKLYTSVFEEAEKLRSDRALPLIATGHLYASDLEGRLSGKKSSEKTDDGVKVLDVVGTLGNVPPSVFPPVDYVALGHIHYSSMVAKNPAIRYSGSPFVMGFDEANLPHYVLLVDAEKNGGGSKLNVEKIETPRIFLYKRISGTLLEVKKELEALSSSKSSGSKDEKKLFIELCYKRELGISAREFLEETIKALPENMSVVNWKITDPEAFFARNEVRDFEASEVKNLDDREIFTQLILAKTGFSAESEEGRAALEKFLPLFLQIAD
ncbi:MAG: exonuclease subunit SbcD [Treponema sp.]|nr:exonuclease subunit SbcD [Treponema sp.]